MIDHVQTALRLHGHERMPVEKYKWSRAYKEPPPPSPQTLNDQEDGAAEEEEEEQKDEVPKQLEEERRVSQTPLMWPTPQSPWKARVNPTTQPSPTWQE